MYHNNKKEDFKKYILENVGVNFKSETVEMYRCIHSFIIEKKYENKYLSVLKKYKIPFKIIDNKKEKEDFFKDFFELKKSQIKDEYIGIKYLEQYEKRDITAKNVFEKVIDNLWYIPSVRKMSGSVRKYDIDDFDEIKPSDAKCIFVVDKKNEEVSKNIVKHVLSIDVIIQNISLENEDFDIKGLSYFKIPDIRQTENGNCNSYRISCVLMDGQINYCIFRDINEKISFDFSIIEKDTRNSVIGFRSDLKQVFRSSWEANLARFLNHIGIEWEYEKISFEVESGYYYPDFFLKNNKIIELKGFWDNESRKKVLSFRENHSDFRLFVVDSDIFYSIDKIYKNIILNWEECNVEIKEEKIPVVGINIMGRKKYVEQLIIGDEVCLYRDFENIYDKNAIKVTNKDGYQIGFISKDWATIFAEKIDIGVTYKAKVKDVQANVVYLNIKRSNLEDNLLLKWIEIIS